MRAVLVSCTCAARAWFASPEGTFFIDTKQHGRCATPAPPVARRPRNRSPYPLLLALARAVPHMMIVLSGCAHSLLPPGGGGAGALSLPMLPALEARGEGGLRPPCPVGPGSGPLAGRGVARAAVADGRAPPPVPWLCHG